MDVYDEMAEFYDLIYSDRLDLEFYLREARNARGPVLEVACGTGRILLRLLREGVDAYGIDISEGMLGILARKAAQEKLPMRAEKGDMSAFSLGKRFRLIIVPYRSFLHLPDKQARERALRAFMEHLEPGGRLILHTYNPSREELAMTGGYHNYDVEELESPDGVKYTLSWHLHYEPLGRIARYKIEMTGGQAGKREFRMDICFVEQREISGLLKGCGFRNIRQYCGFGYEPFHEGCKEAVWIAER